MVGSFINRLVVACEVVAYIFCFSSYCVQGKPLYSDIVFLIKILVSLFAASVKMYLK